MSQPVKLSDDLVLDARVTSEVAQRSIAGQIEFWASLGRAVEVLLRSPELGTLKQAKKSKSVLTALQSVGTPAGDRRLADYLKAQPFPHYESAAGKPGMLIRIEEDGTRSVGRFVQRKFVPEKARRSR
ncbi:MAG: hypothetical protein ABJB74_01315, partial [Gemmatimonas sp.]